MGWLDRKAFRHERDIEAAYTQVDVASYAVTEDDDARDALSRMLSQGVVSLPVVSAQGNLLGALDLIKVVSLTAETTHDEADL